MHGRMMTWRRERSKIRRTGRSDHVPSADSSSKVGEGKQSMAYRSAGPTVMIDVKTSFFYTEMLHLCIIIFYILSGVNLC